MKLNAIAAASFLAATLVASNAQAGGFLADVFVKPFSPELAATLDGINHVAGNPVDHFIARGVDTVIPGGGAAMELNWEFQKMQDRLNSRPQNTGSAMGNYCDTPAGIFGPGPVNPIGSYCWADTAWGPVDGVVTR